MQTKHITLEVPHFPGYKCIGYDLPKKGQKFHDSVSPEDLKTASFDFSCQKCLIYEPEIDLAAHTIQIEKMIPMEHFKFGTHEYTHALIHYTDGVFRCLPKQQLLFDSTGRSEFLPLNIKLESNK